MAEHTETKSKRISCSCLLLLFSFYQQWLNTQKLRESKRITCSCLPLLLVFTSNGWTHRNRIKTDLLFMSVSAFSFYQQWLNTQKLRESKRITCSCLLLFLVFTSNGWTHRNKIKTDLCSCLLLLFSFYQQWLNTQKLRESKRITCSCLLLLLVFTSNGWTHRNRIQTDLLFMSVSAFSFYQQWLNTQKLRESKRITCSCLLLLLVFTSNGWTHRNWENPNGSLVHVCLCF